MEPRQDRGSGGFDCGRLIAGFRLAPDRHGRKANYSNSRPSTSGQSLLKVAGAGLIPNPATADLPKRRAVAHRIEEACELREPLAR
jgi:hypothetical protein